MSKRIKIIAALMMVLSILVFTGCSKTNDTAEKPAEPETAQTEEQAEASDEISTDDTQSAKDVLVVYFSATGTTKGVAEKIASITNADIYQIKPAQEYTSEDLDWNNSDSRTTHEQNDPSVRPEIGSDPISLEGYSTIYIGFPIWWGEEPRIMDTFVETYDFEGITMIPFCTSGSSSIGNSGKNLESNAGSGNWLDGMRFDGGVSEEDLRAWIDELPLVE